VLPLTMLLVLSLAMPSESPNTHAGKTCATGTVPEFPEFVELGREHQALLEQALRAAQPTVSELTFAYQWSWLPYTRCRIAWCDDAVLLMSTSPQTGRAHLLPPITPDAEYAARIIERALSACGDGDPAAFARVPAEVAQLLADRPALTVAEEPERADYVHVADELRELPGGAFRQKRQHVEQFWKAFPDAEVLELDEALLQSCARFCREWLQAHPRSELPGLRREVDVAVRMLENCTWLGLKGIALAARGRVLGFALGEALNAETFLERVEKAEGRVPGAYQAVCQQFALRAAAGYRWINREQDLGIPGLRKAKRSYNPHHMVRKYRISPR